MLGRKMTIRSKNINKITQCGKYLQILMLLLVLGSCNFGTPDYRLDVILEEGVTGTPIAGEHFHKDLSDVSYEYTGIDPIHSVEVFINDLRQTYTGTFSMFTDVTLIARLIDLRGRWDITIQKIEPTETFVFEITLDGAGITNGTFSDSRGYSGTWTAENGVVTMTYSDWNSVRLEGAVYEMSGVYFEEEQNKGGWTADSLS
jgi:hypothetical protein